MKKLLLVGLIGIVLASCSTRTGHVTGVMGRTVYQPEIPLGMVYIPAGSYNMGENDQDVPFLHQTHSKTVSVQAFYMDQTEITNNEYRQFVNWVRDSIAREKIYAGLEDDDEASKYINYTDEYFDEAGSEIVPFEPSDRDVNRSTSDPDASLFSLNWDRDFDYQDPDIIPLLVDMYYPQQERFFKRREIDTRKLNYEYYRIDIRLAASKYNRFLPQKSPDIQDATHDYKKAEYINGVHLNDGVNGVPGTASTPVGDPVKDPKTLGTYDVNDYTSVGNGNYAPRERKGVDRSVFILKDVINVYPDTLAWVHDFTYSFNEPMTNMYFWHPAYDDYPVVGVTWKQARAFSIWRSNLLNNFLIGTDQSIVNDFRLPTEV